MSEPGSRGDIGALRSELERIGPLVVAFSGGADSAFLAWVATDTLGPELVRCVTAVSPSLAPEELADCRALAAEWGLRHLEVMTDELADPAYAANDGSRCYHCKTSLLDALGAAGHRAGRRPGGHHRPGCEPRRPRRPPARATGGGRARGALPAGHGRVHQGGRAGLVEAPRPADLGQAGGGMPGVAGSLRHPGDPGYAPLRGRRRIATARAWASGSSGCATTATRPASRCPKRTWPPSWPGGRR